MKKILVPTDFSSPSQTAVKFAEVIAAKTRAVVWLLHIVELAQGESFSAEGEVTATKAWMDKVYTMKTIEQARKQLATTAENLKHKGLTVKTTLKLGDPVHALRAILDKSSFDLVIMGTVGRTGVDAAVYGSTTVKVVRFSRCPVLTVHAGSKLTDCKSIVYPTALKRNEDIFSRSVRETQKIFGSTIHMVHINTPGDFYTDSVIRKYMTEMAKRLKLSNYTINIFNDYTTEDGIFNFAESVNGDLIAMATHKRGVLSHVFMGKSIAEDVARHASLPVLTLGVK